MTDDDPHGETELATAGAPLGSARGAVILVHGRGATATGILDLGREVAEDDIALLAPQAAGNTWYPNSFLAPVETNEPGRSSGLARIDQLVTECHEAGIAVSDVAIIGFSQGACLASEYVARHPRRYGGVGVLSGGLIGETIHQDDYTGDLEGTPVVIGCSDRDPHIPVERVDATAAVFDRLNAAVTKRLYTGMGHGINQDELDRLAEVVESIGR